MPDGRRGELATALRRIILQQLPGFEAQRLVTVDHTFGCPGGARREGDQCRSGRVGGDGACHRLRGQELLEARLPHQTDYRHVRAQVGMERHPAELRRGEEHLGFGGGQDVGELLAAVEMHDRHRDRAEKG